MSGVLKLLGVAAGLFGLFRLSIGMRAVDTLSDFGRGSDDRELIIEAAAQAQQTLITQGILLIVVGVGVFFLGSRLQRRR